jgi:anti-sigma factor RsiW
MNALKEVPSLNPKHRSDDVVDYHFGDLSPDDRGEFERHLFKCLGCQKAVRTAGQLFPAVAEVLAVPKRRKTTQELVDMMMEETRRLEAEDRKKARAKVQRALYWAAPLVAAAAAASAAGPRAQVLEWAAKLTGSDRNEVAAPPHPEKPARR